MKERKKHRYRNIVWHRVRVLHAVRYGNGPNKVRDRMENNLCVCAWIHMIDAQIIRANMEKKLTAVDEPKQPTASTDPRRLRT